jgi:hypothetical protein
MLGLFILFPWSGQAADIYKWTDEKGDVHISNTPPVGAAKGMKTVLSNDGQKSANDDASQDDSDWPESSPEESR